MNCLLAGAPGGTTTTVARAFLAAAPDAPLTVLSDDTAGMLGLLDEPGLGSCECLWAEAGRPETVDDALVHRRMLHGRPDVVVLAVDRHPADGGSAWPLGELLAQRLSGTPLVVTGVAADAVAPLLTDALRSLADDGGVTAPHVVVPGDDPGTILRATADLLRSLPAPSAEPVAPLLAGHCGH